MGERTRDGVDKVSQWQLPKSQTEDSGGTWWRNRRVVHQASYRGLVLTTELPSLVPMQKLCLHGFHDKQHMILGYGAIIPNKHKRTPNLEWLRSPSTSPDPLDSQFQCLFCTEFLGLRISEDFPPLWCISVQKSVLFLAFSSNTNFSPQCRSLTEIWKPDSCKEIYINPLLSPITNFFFFTSANQKMLSEENQQQSISNNILTCVQQSHQVFYTWFRQVCLWWLWRKIWLVDNTGRPLHWIR